MSLSILIAEDEKIERQALFMQIQNAFPDITLLEPAENGIELLERAKTTVPDIVIADIEMPGMNGLEALEQLRQCGIHPIIVIMTAYSSEQHLKESLALRVFEYLEKPIQRKRMLETIRSLISEVETEKAKREEFAQMQSAIHSVRKMVRSELMTTIETDGADQSQVSQLIDMLEFNTGRFLIVTFSIHTAHSSQNQMYNARITELQTFEEITSVVKSKGWISGHILKHHMSCLVPVMMKVEHDNDYHLRHVVCCEVDKILNSLHSNVEISAGIGTSTTDPGRLQDSLHQSLQALYRQDCHQAIYHYEDQPFPGNVQNPFLDEKYALLSCVQSGSIEGAEAAIKKIFCSLSTTPVELLRNQVFEMLLEINRKSGSILLHEPLNDVSERILKCCDKESIEDVVTIIFEECVQNTRKEDNLWQEDIIESAKNYIDAFYSKDISLEDTAKAVGVSKFYLSRLFKARLGTNYSIYLAEKRVHVAAELLKTRKDKTNRQIASLVGFNDSDYFGKVFKRVMGVTVSEYCDNKYKLEDK